MASVDSFNAAAAGAWPPDGGRDLRREAFPLLHRVMDDGCVTGDVRRLFRSYIDSLTVSWMASDVEYLNTHFVELPDTKERKSVSSLLLSRESAYFDRLIFYSTGSLLPLPFNELPFLRNAFSELIAYIGSSGRSFRPSEESCLDLYLSADFVLHAGLRLRLLEFIKERCATNLTLALNVWTSAKSLFLPELTTAAFEELLRSFELAAKLPSWLELKVEELVEVVSHDGLNARSEALVFDAVRSWLLADWQRRREFGAEALSCVRLGVMSHDQLFALRQQDLVQFFPNLRDAISNVGDVPSGEATSAGRVHLSGVSQRHRQPHEVALVFGGWCQEEGPKAACQVFNPRANTWTLWMPGPGQPAGHICQIERRVYAGCVIVDGVVHLVGGYDGRSALKTVACYNTATNAGWYEGSCMHYKRYYVCCAELDGCIYAIGGHTGETQNGRLSTVERLTVSDNSWVQVASMQLVRSDAGAAALGARVFVVGGFDGRNYHDSAEVYEPELDQWTLISRMNSPRGGVALVAFGNALYAIGGNDGTRRLNVIEKYETEADGWVFSGRLTRRKSNLSACAIDNSILIIGGWSDEREVGILAAAERFNPVTEISENVHDMRFPASATAACTLRGRHTVAQYVDEHASDETSESSGGAQAVSSDTHSLPTELVFDGQSI